MEEADGAVTGDQNGNMEMMQAMQEAEIEDWEMGETASSGSGNGGGSVVERTSAVTECAGSRKRRKDDHSKRTVHFGSASDMAKGSKIVFDNMKESTGQRQELHEEEEGALPGVDSMAVLRHVKTDVGRIAVLLFNDVSQARHTYVCTQLVRDMTNCIRNLGNSVDCSLPVALVLKSGRRDSFLMGRKLSSLFDKGGPESLAEFFDSFHRLLDALSQCSVPSYALINGVCVGEGMELALACDYRLADCGKRGKMGVTQVKLGMIPTFALFQLPLIMGSLDALPYLLLGRAVSSSTAVRLGLIDELLPSGSTNTPEGSDATGRWVLALKLLWERRQIVNVKRRFGGAGFFTRLWPFRQVVYSVWRIFLGLQSRRGVSNLSNLAPIYSLFLVCSGVFQSRETVRERAASFQQSILDASDSRISLTKNALVSELVSTRNLTWIARDTEIVKSESAVKWSQTMPFSSVWVYGTGALAAAALVRVLRASGQKGEGVAVVWAVPVSDAKVVEDTRLSAKTLCLKLSGRAEQRIIWGRVRGVRIVEIDWSDDASVQNKGSEYATALRGAVVLDCRNTDAASVEDCALRVRRMILGETRLGVPQFERDLACWAVCNEGVGVSHLPKGCQICFAASSGINLAAAEVLDCGGGDNAVLAGSAAVDTMGGVPILGTSTDVCVGELVKGITAGACVAVAAQFHVPLHALDMDLGRLGWASKGPCFSCSVSTSSLENFMRVVGTVAPSCRAITKLESQGFILYVPQVDSMGRLAKYLGGIALLLSLYVVALSTTGRAALYPIVQHPNFSVACATLMTSFLLCILGYWYLQKSRLAAARMRVLCAAANAACIGLVSATEPSARRINTAATLVGGFPLALGGPLAWIDSVGPSRVLAELERARSGGLSEADGALFSASNALVQAAKSGNPLYLGAGVGSNTACPAVSPLLPGWELTLGMLFACVSVWVAAG